MNKEKIMQGSSGVKNIIQEIKVHWDLDQCEGILRLLELYEDTELIYLVLEYQPQGSLLSEIFKQCYLDENSVRVIMEQCLLTLDFIHEKGIIHRDIKIENILINKRDVQTGYDVRIADFGIATTVDPDKSVKCFHQCGTPGYAAPEMLKGRGYDTKADVFSLGVVLFNILTGYHLFSGKSDKELLNKNMRCNKIVHIIENLPGISGKCREVLIMLL